MQPPISPGTVLRDRYIVKQVIGQGGMGRTYTAQDTERFNEICVLKEFIPATQSPEIIIKAKELFQREANTLYQIRHPQVPEFRATFEADSRLFLVQDYVEGKNYRTLMNDRRMQGNHFTEAEIITLFQQVLPILSYLHSRNIIHRDVSPENLMLRNRDRLPVLIDFGVVKEAATQLHSQAGLPQSTMAGKLGYAPPEQMQSGRAYASSDLYALAVTALVLLTGREPQELFDDHSLSWHWEQFTTISPNLAQVINRMLSYKPAQRFSSAEEVIQALQLNQASLSEVKTYAVGRPVAPNLVTALPEKTVYANNQNHLAIPPQQQLSSQPDRGINVFWGILLVLFSGVASWAIASLIFGRTASIDPTPTPTPTVSTPIPTPTATITNVNKNLEFEQNPNNASVTGKVTTDRTITYRLNAVKGQKMTVSLTGQGLIMTLKYVDQKPIDNTSSNIDLGYWSGRLPATGAYFIIIATTSGVTESDYNLDVQLETPTPKPTPSPSPSPTVTPTPDPTPTPEPTPTESVPVPSSKSFNGNLRSGDVKTYPITVRDGQALVVILREGLDDVRLEVLDPSGNPVYGRVNNNSLQVDSTQAGTYQIRVSSRKDSATSFAFDVSAR